MTRKINALVIDDSAVARRSVMRLIERTELADFSFTEAVDGVAALEKYEGTEFDILFVDMHMPRMDGMEFLTVLNEKHANHPPAVLVTADDNRERLISMVNEARVSAVMMKPLDSTRMFEGLQKLLATIPDRTGVWSVPHGEVIGEALRDITRQLCGVELEQIDVTAANELKEAVFCMIYVSGGLDWALTLGFNRVSAEHISSCLAQEKLEFQSLDLLDAIAEVTNTFAGQLKRLLLERNIHVNFSLPTVVGADGLRFYAPAGEQRANDKICFTNQDTDSGSAAGSASGLVWVSVNAGMQNSLMF
jgi:CheY-like chemotaxis protein